MKWLALISLSGILAITVFVKVSQDPFRGASGKMISQKDSEIESEGNRALQHRYSARLNADGSMPETALMTALEQKSNLELAQGLDVATPSWTYLGPDNVGGRIRAIVVSPLANTVIYLASVGGGIWKTANGGISWFSLNDNFPSMSVGALIMDKNNSQVLYAGTGESYFDTTFGENNKAAIQGAGIYKTTDGGNSWIQLASTRNADFNCVARLSMSPSDSNTLLAATNTGLFRTTDAGVTWTKVYNGKVGDVDFHPTDASKVVAGIFTAPGIIRSSDGGLTWINSSGIASSLRCETAWSRSVTGNVYAAVCGGANAKVWKSTDFGATWALKSTGSGPGNYESYNVALWVDPTNDNNVIVGGVNIYRSTNQGALLTQAFSNVHADVHAIVEEPAFDGTGKRNVWFATDGGIFNAVNVYANTVTSLNSSLGITQFYGGAINNTSGRLVAGAQDNSSQVYSGSFNWTGVIGGDGVHCVSDPAFPSTFYAGYYYMNMFRSADAGVSFPTDITGGISERNSELTCNFIPYLSLDPNNSNSMYACCKSLWRSNNIRTGAPPSWSVIKVPIASPPPNDPPHDHFAPESPLNLSFVAVAPSNSNVIWASHNNGQIWVSTNGQNAAPSWTRVDTNGPLPARWPSCLTIDPANANHVYVSFLGWASDNIWETTDGGASFHTVIGSGLRQIPSAPVSALSYDSANPGHLIAGTDIGIFTSWDNGTTWSTSTQGPGTVPIDFFQWRNSSQLMAYTYGRGVWQGQMGPVDVNVLPNSVSIFRGNYISGSVTDVASSDDLYYRVARGLVATPVESPIQIDFTGTAPGTIAKSITLTTEAAVNTANLLQRIQAFNYDTNTYDEKDLRSATLADQVVNVTISNNVSSYIHPTTRQMKLRFSISQGGLVPTLTWNTRLDLVKWTIKQ